ncbi:MAG: hypothetical protein FWB85_08565 [Chitinispirillia bacterium]|nr:hypothetical protein [Chitinispirillia bacterium]MCL2242231.1 hypothetical protein [Chitinispirillia bacterium]
MDNEEKEASPEGKKYEPYASTGGDGGVLEVREPTMYYGEVCGEGGRGTYVRKKGGRSGNVSEGPYAEVDIDDDEAWEAEIGRLSRIFRMQHGLSPEEPSIDLDHLNEDPEKIEAFFRERETNSPPAKEGESLPAEESWRRLKRRILDELRLEIVNGKQ